MIFCLTQQLPTQFQVKQSSRGVKTAYKDLKSKLKDTNSPPKFHANHDNGHHSAPTSPVSTRKFQAESSYRKPTHSQVVQSTSQLWNGLNGYNHNNNVSKSPTLSPPSSNSCSSSDMNILPELQEYAFFKTPAVDRSVSTKLFIFDLFLDFALKASYLFKFISFHIFIVYNFGLLYRHLCMVVSIRQTLPLCYFFVYFFLLVCCTVETNKQL